MKKIYNGKKSLLYYLAVFHDNDWMTDNVADQFAGRQKIISKREKGAWGHLVRKSILKTLLKRSKKNNRLHEIN
jgi:hypothetical protein